MIVLKAKAESPSTSAINVSTLDEKSTAKPSLSFGELLRGEGVKIQGDENAPLAQKGTVVLALDDKEVVLPVKLADDAKQTTQVQTTLDTKETNESKLLGLEALLKGDAAILGEELEQLQLNPKATQNMSIKELKTLINDAKSYLKEQILKSDGYKDAQIKELPKTLKGLTQLAKRFEIDISKITLEQVQVKRKPLKTVETEIKTPLKISDDAVALKRESKVDTKTLKSSKPLSSTVDTNADAQEEIKQTLKQDNKQNMRLEAKSDESIKVSQTPLFKAQAKVEPASTEQVVQAKQFVAQPTKTPKDRADETLKLLLRGEKPTNSKANITADFSVATAKVIAPNTTTDTSRSLEALLRGDTTGQNTEVKTEQVTTPKADSFEVKLNEAKQMIKYLSTDVKQAIQDYKSPFTRVKVQLNPQQLGSVELTVIQRGKNLHVNISSNNVAVNALATNLSELKTQLNNTGINNATFNFNSGSENGSSNNGQQNNRQQEQQDANEEYNYFDQDTKNEEILSSLEIVVPSYA